MFSGILRQNNLARFCPNDHPFLMFTAFDLMLQSRQQIKTLEAPAVIGKKKPSFFPLTLEMQDRPRAGTSPREAGEF